ncbi:MAG TPA: TIGR03905 family TSCPD domain-containing protein [Methylomusa anaerophila]|uniref:ribonucleoside-diphosphate reductase n=1 Tax=Methylomusa anaerophila TaxID=1930071 RepID=A0A348ANM6_9FIRM|nr:TIGR03905 family TSCPD domain-containing protein [Methylomusa anaerophila]BBB92674.1 TSCPD domain protein [Methylomusa anaerophila]HML87473.1 TIGR03905 family TSCPD domain-containing protein [Methylomusa anaerophila]
MSTFTPVGVCAKQIDFSVKDGIVQKIVFHSGCPGNLQGVSRLAEGRPVEEVISRLKGIQCGDKGTSCPDQLARALEANK